MNKNNLMDVESYLILLGASLKGTLLKAREMEEVDQLESTVDFTMENGRMTCRMDSDKTPLKVMLNMKVTTTGTFRMPMDFINL